MDEAFIGSVHLNYQTLASTNRFVQTLLSKTRPRAGTVISTAFQSAGEGQFGRSWFGSKGTNLCLSVILYPQIPATAQFILSAFTALAVRDTVAHFIEKDIYVKWPNDIYVEDRKIGGILIQNSISGQSIQNSIIGIGLNVNEASFPADIHNPTSLAIEARRLSEAHNVTTDDTKEPDRILKDYTFEPNYVMKKLLGFLNDWHERARNLPPEMLQKQYISHLYKRGEVCTFYNSETDQRLSACIKGVDDSGKLLLEHSDTEYIEAFSFNQIRLIV